jgi:hypothetical protein
MLKHLNFVRLLCFVDKCYKLHIYSTLADKYGELHLVISMLNVTTIVSRHLQVKNVQVCNHLMT